MSMNLRNLFHFSPRLIWISTFLLNFYIAVAELFAWLYRELSAVKRRHHHN